MSDTIQPTVTDRDGVIVISFGTDAESIYESAIADFRDPILDQFQLNPPAAVVVELQYTKYFGSAFLAFLNHLKKTIEGHNAAARLGVCSLTPYGETVIKMSQLDKIWEIYETLDAALEAMAAPQG